MTIIVEMESTIRSGQRSLYVQYVGSTWLVSYAIWS